MIHANHNICIKCGRVSYDLIDTICDDCNTRPCEYGEVVDGVYTICEAKGEYPYKVLVKDISYTVWYCVNHRRSR